MNGFELYKKYITIGEASKRDTPEWSYAQTLTEAFYVVGVTYLFDMLEKAEEQGMRIEIVCSDSTGQDMKSPCSIQLVSREPVTGKFDNRISAWKYPSYAPDGDSKGTMVAR
jgi:hypothetical protein